MSTRLKVSFRGRRVTVDVDQSWRDPVIGATCEERPTREAPHGMKGRRPITWWLDSERDVQRMLRGQVCWQCLTPLPDWPSRDNVPLYAGTGLIEWHANALRRVQERCCPMCGCEVTPEMIRLMVDIKQGSPGTPNDITDADHHKLGLQELAAQAEATERMSPAMMADRVDVKQRQIIVPGWVGRKKG